MRETINRKSKDSVFVKLFEDKNNILQLYKDMYPDEADITLEDIDIQTLKSVIVNTQYNDLGFTVKNKCIMLVEAQSSWNPNMPIRMLFYVAETLKRYIEHTEQSEHQPQKLSIPTPELYILYSGKKEVPPEISLNEEFFNGKSAIDVRVKVFNQVDTTLAGQYIGFCRVFDEQRKLYDDPIKIAKETYRICIERGYLTAFMKDHEAEVVTMMSELFNEEYMREKYDRAERVRNINKGKAEMIETFRKLGVPEETIQAAIRENQLRNK